MSVFRQLSDLAAAAAASQMSAWNNLRISTNTRRLCGELAAAAPPALTLVRPGGNTHDKASASYSETVSGGAATRQEVSNSVFWILNCRADANSCQTHQRESSVVPAVDPGGKGRSDQSRNKLSGARDAARASASCLVPDGIKDILVF